MEFVEWQGNVINSISLLLDCTYSDATGIYDAQESYADQAWGKGMNAEDTAKLIIDKSTVH